jgi:hypothetical protein
MKKGVRVVAKGIKRSEPDLRKLARALIQLVMEQQAKAELLKQDENETGEVTS